MTLTMEWQGRGTRPPPQRMGRSGWLRPIPAKGGKPPPLKTTNAIPNIAAVSRSRLSAARHADAAG